MITSPTVNICIFLVSKALYTVLEKDTEKPGIILHLKRLALKMKDRIP